MMTSILARVLFRHDTSSATMTAPCTDWPVLLMLSYSPKNTAFSSMPVRKKEWEKNASNWALLPPYILYLCHEGAASINTAPGVKKMIPCPLHIELMSTHPYVETYINENLHTHIHIKVFFFFFCPHQHFLPNTEQMSIHFICFLFHIHGWCPYGWMRTLSNTQKQCLHAHTFCPMYRIDVHTPTCAHSPMKVTSTQARVSSLMHTALIFTCPYLQVHNLPSHISDIPYTYILLHTKGSPY